jgi:hypothetical protein
MTLLLAPALPGDRETSTRTASADSRHLSAMRPTRGAGLSAFRVGGVASYLIAKDALLAFPATSRQVPVTWAAGLSGPEYVVLLQAAIPEIGSLPWNANATGWFHQPS